MAITVADPREAALPDVGLPAIIRATSATRASAPSRSTEVWVRPFLTALETRKCRSAWLATCARWVTAKTWPPAARRRSLAPRLSRSSASGAGGPDPSPPASARSASAAPSSRLAARPASRITSGPGGAEIPNDSERA